MFTRSTKFGFAAVLVSFVSFASGCAVTEGSGVPSTETRPVATFDRLEIRSGVNARIEVDPTVTSTTLEIRGDDNLVRKVSTRVEGGQLIIDTGDTSVDPELP